MLDPQKRKMVALSGLLIWKIDFDVRCAAAQYAKWKKEPSYNDCLNIFVNKYLSSLTITMDSMDETYITGYIQDQ